MSPVLVAESRLLNPLKQLLQLLYLSPPNRHLLLVVSHLVLHWLHSRGDKQI